MDTWLILLIVAILFLVLEMFTPTMFFINLSIATLVSAFFSYCGYSNTIVTFAFLIVSIASIGFLRPFLMKKLENKKHETGIESKYIGQIARVVEEVTQTSGRVAIYGEEWNARLNSEENPAIPVGANVKIISNESIVFKVEAAKE